MFFGDGGEGSEDMDLEITCVRRAGNGWVGRLETSRTIIFAGGAHYIDVSHQLHLHLSLVNGNNFTSMWQGPPSAFMNAACPCAPC